jgi:hypothetical protein
LQRFHGVVAPEAVDVEAEQMVEEVVPGRYRCEHTAHVSALLGCA